MHTDDTQHDSSRDTYMVIVISIVIGVPFFVFFNLITFWMFLDVIIGTGIIAGFCGANYLLWGRAMTREVASMQAADEIREVEEAEQFELKHLDDRFTPRMPN